MSVSVKIVKHQPGQDGSKAEGHSPIQQGQTHPIQGQAGYGNPIIQQPGPLSDQPVFMPMPQASSSCPPGLEYLTQIDQLLIKQKVELLELFTGFETNNKYKLFNSIGQQVYYAAEDTDCLTRNCCGPLRPFEIKLFDNVQREVLTFQRPLRCGCCCCPCCLQEIDICSSSGEVLGHVVQLWSLCAPKFEIQNANRETVLLIQGPICVFKLCGDVEFQVLSTDGFTQVGKISKQWTGLCKEYMTDSDNFAITFPMDLDVNIKAVMLGACFLLDFMFFEDNNSN